MASKQNNNEVNAIAIAAPMYIVIKVKKFLIGFVILLAIIAISGLYSSTAKSTQGYSPTTSAAASASDSMGTRSNSIIESKSIETNPSMKSNNSSSKKNPPSSSSQATTMKDSKFNLSSVQLDKPFGSGVDKKTLEFYHCGGNNGEGVGENKQPVLVKEVILLHGAAFTKEDWVTSGILEQFCLKGSEVDVESTTKESAKQSTERKSFRFLALDLSVRADGDGFRNAVESLIQSGALSGNPVAVISPSAGGKAIVSLAENQNNLKKLISHWIPVASGAVLQVKDDDDNLTNFSSVGVRVLAINGDGDKMGKKVTQKLVKSIEGAKGLELKGGHPCYLDSPNEFVDSVMDFINDGGFKNDS